jgi:hypothetical protein
LVFLCARAHRGFATQARLFLPARRIRANFWRAQLDIPQMRSRCLHFIFHERARLRNASAPWLWLARRILATFRARNWTFHCARCSRSDFRMGKKRLTLTYAI